MPGSHIETGSEKKIICIFYFSYSTGIDVDVSVEHNGIRQRCSLNDNDLQSRQSPTSKSPTSSTPPPQSNDAAAAPSASSSTNMEVQTDMPENPAEMEVTSPPEAEAQMESDVEDWTLVNRDSNSPDGRPRSGTKQPKAPAESSVEYPSLQDCQTHPGIVHYFI